MKWKNTLTLSAITLVLGLSTNAIAQTVVSNSGSALVTLDSNDNVAVLWGYDDPDCESGYGTDLGSVGDDGGW